MAGMFAATVTFNTTQQRNRATTAVQAWMANWNTANPAAQFSGMCTQGNLDVFDGSGPHPALFCNYVCQDYAGAEEAERVINEDVNGNTYREIVSMQTSRMA
jgi:hypothetical protein